MDNMIKDKKNTRIKDRDDKKNKDMKMGAGTACPEAPMIGSDGNILNQVTIASKVLKENGQRKQAKEMSEKVFRAESYDEALGIITEYVNPVDKLEYMKKSRDRNMGIER